MIEIGNDTKVSAGVTFITHDGSTWCFRKNKDYKDILRYGKIIIGDNCFIGYRSIIMPNVKIGDNCVVAAGSVVTKNIPNGEVWGGNPAKFISKTYDLGNKFKEQTPQYDILNYKNNKKDEVIKIADKMVKIKYN